MTHKPPTRDDEEDTRPGIHLVRDGDRHRSRTPPIGVPRAHTPDDPVLAAAAEAIRRADPQWEIGVNVTEALLYIGASLKVLEDRAQACEERAGEAEAIAKMLTDERDRIAAWRKRWGWVLASFKTLGVTGVVALAIWAVTVIKNQGVEQANAARDKAALHRLVEEQATAKIQAAHDSAWRDAVDRDLDRLFELFNLRRTP